MQHLNKQALPFYVAFVILGIAVLVAYGPGLRGPFVFDDIPNIVNNKPIATPVLNLTGLSDAVWSGGSGPLKRPAAFLSFYIDALLVDGVANSLPFKLTNLLIHLLNVVLVYLLARELLKHATGTEKNVSKDHRTIAVVAAAMWALHPMHATTVLYVVQRMTSMATLFVLLGMILFLSGRRVLAASPKRAWILMWSGLGIGLLLGLCAKENAAVIPFLLLSVELTLFDRSQFETHTHHRLRLFYFVVCGIPLLMAAMWLIIHPELISQSYASRDFGPIERLLTEARALWFYLGLLLIPDVTTLTLFHDDFQLSTGLTEPWTTSPAVAGAILLVAAAIALRRRLPMFSLAVFWFLIAHSIESTVLGLELVHEHRNYLPDIVLFIAAAYGLWHVGRKNRRRLLTGTIFLALTLAYAGITFLRATTWSSEAQLIESMAAHHPRSARSQAVMAELLAYRENKLAEAVTYFRMAMELSPNETATPIRLVTAAVELRDAPTQSSSAELIPDLSQLSDRISQQLASGTPRPTTLAVLNQTVNCVVNLPNRCRELYAPAFTWSHALLHNPELTPDLRFFSTDLILRLTIWRKDYESALAAVNYVKSLEPDNDQYTLMEADVYRLLRNFDRAEKILDTLAVMDRRNAGEFRQQVDHLRTLILSSKVTLSRDRN